MSNSLFAVKYTILLGKTLGLIILMAQLSLIVASPTIQMTSTGNGEHVISSANNAHHRTLSLTNLTALEEVYTTEMIKAFMNNVLMAQLSAISISTSVHSSLVIDQNRCFLSVTNPDNTHITDVEAENHASFSLLQQGRRRNDRSFQSRAQLFFIPPSCTYTSAFVISPSIHYSLRLFSLRKFGKVVTAMFAIPISLRNLHHLFELFVGHLSTTIATRLR